MRRVNVLTVRRVSLPPRKEPGPLQPFIWSLFQSRCEQNKTKSFIAHFTSSFLLRETKPLDPESMSSNSDNTSFTDPLKAAASLTVPNPLTSILKSSNLNHFLLVRV